MNLTGFLNNKDWHLSNSCLLCFKFEDRSKTSNLQFNVGKRSNSNDANTFPVTT